MATPEDLEKQQKKIEEQVRKAALESALLENKERAHAGRLALLQRMSGGLSQEAYNIYADNPETLRRYLNKQYAVSNTDGIVNIGQLPRDVLRIGMVVGVLEFMSNSPMPITAPEGGSPEQHIELLKNLLAIDYSVEPVRLAQMAAGIRQFIAGNLDHPDAEHIDTLLALSETNANLHTSQKSSAIPLTQAQRRSALAAAIGGGSDAEALLAECDKDFKAVTQSLAASSSADLSRAAPSVDTSATAGPAKAALAGPKPMVSASAKAFPRSQSVGDIDAFREEQERNATQESKAVPIISPRWTTSKPPTVSTSSISTPTSASTQTSTDGGLSSRRFFGSSS